MTDRVLVEDIAQGGTRPASRIRRVLEQACAPAGPYAGSVLVDLTAHGVRVLARVQHPSVTGDEAEAARAACARRDLVAVDDEPSGTILAVPVGDGFAVICRLRAQVTRRRLERARALAETLALAMENEWLQGERRRVASDAHGAAAACYDLHDGPAQKLLWVRNTLAQLARDAVDGKPASAGALGDLHAVTDAALADVQRVIGDLGAGARPAERPLDELLRDEVVLLYRREDVEVELALCGDLAAGLDPAVTLAAFRIAQEAMTNAVRHGAARHLRISTALDAGRLVLRCEDDGAGFDVAAALAHAGLGLRGMQERARLVGGRVEIDSRPEASTCVHATLPALPNGPTPYA
jgi:signal transduction histidine kinase